MYGESPQACSSATGWLSRPSRARSRDHQLGPRWRDAQLTSPSERMGTRCCTVTGNQSPHAMGAGAGMEWRPACGCTAECPSGNWVVYSLRACEQL
jgi:hypothetical protein